MSLLIPAASPSVEDQPPPPLLLPPSSAATPLPDVMPKITPNPVISPPAPPVSPLPSLPLAPPAPSPERAPLVAPPLPAAFPPSTPADQNLAPTVTSPPAPLVVASPPASTAIPTFPVNSPPPDAPPRTVSKSPPAPQKPALPRRHSSRLSPPRPTAPLRTPQPAPVPSLPSAPTERPTKPLPTYPLTPVPPLSLPATPAAIFPTPATATSPSSDEPFFPELALPPPGTQISPTTQTPEVLNGSLPLTGASGQPGQAAAEEFHMSAGLIAGLAVGGALFLVILVIVWLICRRGEGKQGKGNFNKDYYGTQPSGPKGNGSVVHSEPKDVPLPMSHSIAMPLSADPSANPASLTSFSSGSFTYDKLVRATENFSEANLLGEGGFGYVHKGVLSGGKEIAVKQLKIGSDQGEREFRAELETISLVHHKHLVTLLGYCITGSARFLIYEFVPNKTLEFHLHGDGQPVMDWATRLRIAIGSAKGLAYLHEDCSPTIIHRDIKAANILLDFKFEAKVSDFGLAKFFSDTNSHITHISTRVVGTFGYLAPEYASSGKLTEKSDVYSYGMMLLELITGRTPISRTASMMNEALVDWARPLLTRAIKTGDLGLIIDPRLQSNYDSDQMVRMMECAAACIRQSGWLRPRMSQIVRALEENEPLMDLEEGSTPGHSRLYSSLDIKRLTMALTSPEYGPSHRSDNTSDYGLYPSCSSSEAHHTR
ncbi:proline-rich receptor-like protein kinase PERK15 [Punica granatum]|uniref:non-specific serine/threonine protein kinase n=1 Tax=Punica granatum TaxID=22663 RepID=A0A6P8EPB1_PUNGR|nr:proline-rich receptor-like protein kinase PERK15 [Punica granatum]